MVLAYSLLAAICAGTVAWMFVLSWCDRNVPLAMLMGVACFSLLLVALVPQRVAL